MCSMYPGSNLFGPLLGQTKLLLYAGYSKYRDYSYMTGGNYVVQKCGPALVKFADRCVSFSFKITIDNGKIDY